MTWAFIVIAIVMSGLTLGLPYLLHPTGAPSAHGAARSAPNGASAQ